MEYSQVQLAVFGTGGAQTTQLMERQTVNRRNQDIHLEVRTIPGSQRVRLSLWNETTRESIAFGLGQEFYENHGPANSLVWDRVHRAPHNEPNSRFVDLYTMANALREAYPDGTVAERGYQGRGNNELWTRVNNNVPRMYHATHGAYYSEVHPQSISFQLIDEEVTHVELNWH